MPLITLNTFENMRKVRSLWVYTIDTNVFCACNFRFDRSPLKLHPIQYDDLLFVVPEVIYYEIKNKYIESHNWIHDVEKKLRKSSILKINKLYNEFEALNLEEECTIALDKFLTSKRSIILNANQYADFGQILKMYFETLAPFEGNKEKKYEFPDAIALSTLEGYGEQMERNILAISSDRGWINYCEKSKRIFMIDDDSTRNSTKILQFYNDKLQPQAIQESKIIENINIILETSIENQTIIKNEIQQSINENLHLFIPDVKTKSTLSNFYYYGEMQKIDLLELDFLQLQLAFSYIENCEVIAYTPMCAKLYCQAIIDKLQWDDKNKTGIVIESKIMEKEATVELHVDVITLINNYDMDNLTIIGCDIFPDEIEISFSAT